MGETVGDGGKKAEQQYNGKSLFFGELCCHSMVCVCVWCDTRYC